MSPRKRHLVAPEQVMTRIPATPQQMREIMFRFLDNEEQRFATRVERALKDLIMNATRELSSLQTDREVFCSFLQHTPALAEAIGRLNGVRESNKVAKAALQELP